MGAHDDRPGFPAAWTWEKNGINLINENKTQIEIEKEMIEKYFDANQQYWEQNFLFQACVT